jgi:hypothetical protein
VSGVASHFEVLEEVIDEGGIVGAWENVLGRGIVLEAVIVV